MIVGRVVKFPGLYRGIENPPAAENLAAISASKGTYNQQKSSLKRRKVI
jgi:hypothetical protein